MKVVARLQRLVVIVAALLFCGGAASAQCLSGYTYIAPITVVNSGAAVLTNYSVQVTVNTAALVAAGKMRADGGDLRFIDGTDCCQQFGYYIETGMNTSTTSVWVKIPTLAANTSKSISMVYGNPTATSVGSPDSVFALYDDFAATSMNSTKWSQAIGTGSISFPGGTVVFNSTYYVSLKSNAAIPTPCIVEAGVLAASGNWPNLVQLQPGTGNGYGHCMGGATMYMGVDGGGYPGYYANFLTGVGTGSVVGTWTTAWIATGNERITWPGGSITTADAQLGLPSTINVALGCLNGGTGSMTVDWVRVRKYAAVPPSVSSPGTEGTLAPPSITQQPVSRTVCSGSTVTFSITGTGSNFQWRKNGVAIPGANAASYTIPAAAVTDTGSYDVMITANCSPTVVSTAARLTVNTPPNITLQPVGIIGCPGQQITFNTAATGTSVTFQWRKNGIPIPGQTGTAYSIASTAPADAGTYDVVATGICGSPVTSLPATVGVNVPPAVTDQPQDTMICREQLFTLKVAATGTGIKYQWRHNGVPITGATGSTYTHAAQPYDSGSYDVVISGICDPVAISSPAHVGVTSEPILMEQPLTRQAALGQSVTFKVKVDGGGNVTYQWQKDGVDIPGATLSYYTIPLVTLKDIGGYNVVISGTACNEFQTVIVSDAATLLVDAPAEITKQPEGATLCANGTVTLTVGVAGTNLGYQWRHNGVAIPGATSRVYKINTAAVADGGSYDVVITGPSNQVLTSTAATVTVNALASITQQPTSRTICAGQPTDFTIGTTGTNLNYQWMKGGTALPAATSASYSIASAAVADSGMYSVVVTGACGDTVASSEATLTVNPVTAVTLDPTRVDVGHGQAATFTVVATGVGLTYQWYKDGVAIAGATSATLEIPAVNEGMEGFYYAVVSGTCTSDTSQGAKLTVDGLLSVPGEVTSGNGAKLVVVPQPAHGQTRLSIELPAGVHAGEGTRLGLYDGAGRQVLDLSGAYQQSGYSGAEFDANALSSGLYVCRMDGSAWSGVLGVVMVTK